VDAGREERLEVSDVEFYTEAEGVTAMAKRKGYGLAWAVVRGDELLNIAMSRQLARDIASLTDGARVVRATVKYG
jgi:hypothetical protein